MKPSLPLLLLLLVTAAPSLAQKKSTAPVQKKALSHTVYDRWKEISSKALTPDGNYAVIAINPQDGDGKVVFYNLKTGAQDSVKRGDNISLTYDSKYAVFKVRPPQDVVKDLRRKKKKKEDMPKDTLALYSFGTRKTEKIPDVRMYKVPEKAGNWVAYTLEPKKEEKKEDKKTEASQPAPAKKAKKVKKNTDDNGYTLVIRNISGNTGAQYGFVKDFTFAKFGQGLLFTTTGNDSTLKAGMYWYDLAAGQLKTLHQGYPKYKYKGLSISEDGTQAAFVVDADTTKTPVRHPQLYHWQSGEASAKHYDVEHSMALPLNWLVSDSQTPQFSKDGKKLFFGTNPTPVLQDTMKLAEEIVSVEVWGNADNLIYPQQNRQVEAERRRSYLAVMDIGAKAVTQVATIDIPTTEIGDEGNSSVILMETNRPYQRMIIHDPGAYSDFYLFDITSRLRLDIGTRIKGNALLSPKANYVYWYSLTDTTWFVYSAAADSATRLKGLTNFADEEDDHPDYPSQYGAAGWTVNDEALLLYDRYDIWSFDPRGKKQPVNLTKTGRQEKTVFRYLKLDPEERSIDPNKEMMLSAFNETTKQSGFYKLSLKDGKLTKLVMDNYRFIGAIKATQGNQILFTRESFREFPDVWTSDTNLAGMKKLTDANPQMKNYNWGTVELVTWNSLDNVPLAGMLYKPEGFDPKKKYPMITYFYEKESDNIHGHIPPTPLRSSINRSTYVSDGYLVFVPDIVYKIGFPGESAYNAILPGVTALIAKGYVDEKNIGIQGHSWGGYQTAYIVTRTNLFKAGEAGAPVANMISAYGGIRWETGLSRMFQYEHSQSRIGGTLWEKPMHYIENSPIFFADKIQTPLLLLHNDADGAVPWYQGIEMYMALRRLEKPVWMLNYNGEPHWPVKRENRMDFQIRMKQYFDHYLKAAPMPSWMKDGVPATEKGIKTGY
ncbi:MAG TPA: prolyl oligopeptidase family serine peptidase [Cyclobacteriaceae bacterium]|nr:prolyl oligopeptidase family serine peptidase [Cyclobacteriaceae bacterium]